MIDVRRWLASCPPDPNRVEWARCPVCDAPLRSDGVACSGVGRHPVGASVQMYATWTGTRENLAAMHRNGFRCVTGPDQLSRRGTPPLPWFLDNGAWGCFTRGVPFDSDAFRRAMERWGELSDFIVAPDVVGNAAATWELSHQWLDECRATGSAVLFAVQNGMTPEDFEERNTDGVYTHNGVRWGGIFVGGDTQWKLETMAQWADLADRCGVRCHVGRVNTTRRMLLAVDARVTSVDGTSPSRFAVRSDPLGRASRAKPMARLF